VIVVDSTVWVDYFNGVVTGSTERLDGLLGRELVVVGDLILVEVLQGFRSDTDLRKAMSLFDLLEFRPMVGREVALAAAENFRVLRRRGVTVRKTIDVLIATFCMRNDLPLLHDDRDFEPMHRHLGLRAVTA
jgi:predicted nucleic acid-binding protein